MDLNREEVPCNLCGRSRFRKFLDKFGEPIVRCRRCGLIFSNPRLHEEDLFKRYNREYFNGEYLPAFGATRENFNMDAVMDRYSLYLDLLQAAGLPGRRILDIGAGAGFFIKAAERFGWKGEGIEASEEAASYGRDILNVDIKTGKFEHARYEDESFDAVTLLDTIEHLRDPVACLSEVRRILKKNGLLILNTPDIQSLSRLILGRSWAVLSPQEHLYYFNRRTLRAILKKAGLRPVVITTLTSFNPEYTNKRSGARYEWWKKRHAKWDASAWRQKIYGFEYRKIREVVKSDPTNLPDPSRSLQPSGGVGSRLKRLIFSALKSILHGDLLVAVARRDL